MKFQMYIAPQTSPEKKTFSDWSRWLKTSETIRCWVAWDFEMPGLQVRQAPLVAVSPGRGLGRLQGRPTWFELPVPSSLRGQNQFPWGRLSRRLRPAQLLIRLPEVLTTLDFELCEREGVGVGAKLMQTSFCNFKSVMAGWEVCRWKAEVSWSDFLNFERTNKELRWLAMNKPPSQSDDDADR